MNVLRGAAYVVGLSFGIAWFGVLITQFVQRVFAFFADLERPRDELRREQSEWLGGAGGGEIPFHGETL